MNAYIQLLVQKLIDRFTPSAADILLSMKKVEAKLEKAIGKTERDLDNTYSTMRALDDRLVTLNREAGAAYKLLHNVTEMTK